MPRHVWLLVLDSRLGQVGQIKRTSSQKKKIKICEKQNMRWCCAKSLDIQFGKVEVLRERKLVERSSVTPKSLRFEALAVEFKTSCQK
jgi:hypothetical protein